MGFNIWMMSHTHNTFADDYNYDAARGGPTWIFEEELCILVVVLLFPIPRAVVYSLSNQGSTRTWLSLPTLDDATIQYPQ